MNEAIENNSQEIATDEHVSSTEETTTVSTTEETKETSQTTPEATSESTEETIDYEAELSSVVAERDNYRQAYLNEKDKNKNQSKGSVEGDDDDDEDTVDIKNDTGKSVRDIIREEKRSEYVDEISGDMTSNDAERKLILHYYNNVIKHTGSSKADVKSDLETARVLANRKRIARQSKEVAAVVAANSGRQTAGSGGQRQSDTTTVAMSDSDRALLERFGADPKDVRA